jgi:large subunit ribosomal protein L4
MKYELLNKEGEIVDEIELPEKVFNVPLNKDLLWQVIVSYLANQRKNIAHTKTRAEVRGGGKKPWRQKGLGRARHGSIRSPIFIKGGITFGPRKERIFKKKINKKMKKKALLMVLSEKFKNKLLKIVDDLKIEDGKTKTMKNFLKKLGVEKSVLIVLPEKNEKVKRASRNLPKVKTVILKDLNPLLLLQYRYLLLPKEAIDKIK